MTHDPTPYIALAGIRKAYRIGSERIAIFSGLDLAIPRGDFVAVMGPSGSGKSTLLNMLAGIDRPDAGTLRIGTSHLDQMGEAARSSWRAHNMGIVFQFYNLLPMLTAAENVELPLLLKPLSRQERRLRVERALGLV
ncbi:MAG: ATP-binding cassette domain-containing protein, partial [Proteobacteria bacterium]|nr:ATP-binding cassette domain-containing protein [Pseudomonadota bacterium]